MDQEVEQRYHSLLGAFIAKTTNIEGWIDSAITHYFNVDGRVSITFDLWVLGKLGFKAKFEVINNLVDALGERERFKEMLKALERLNGRRNDLAHGHYMQSIVLDVEPHKTELIKWDKRNKPGSSDMFKPLDLDELEKEISSLDELIHPLWQLSALCSHKWSDSEPHHEPNVTHIDGNMLSVTDEYLDSREPK
jgi:hypothetical protein